MSAGEERLARAQPADDGGEAGRAPHLLGQPRVPRHRAAGGGARLADHDAAPVAHARRGGGHGRRRPRDRAATAVGRGRERLAGDELARVAVLRLGVLDLDLGAVEIEHLLGTRERLGLVLARDGDAPPAVEPGVELGEPAGELVLDLQHPVGLAGQRHRRVEVVVVRVVPDLASGPCPSAAAARPPPPPACGCRCAPTTRRGTAADRSAASTGRRPRGCAGRPSARGRARRRCARPPATAAAPPPAPWARRAPGACRRRR